MSNNRYNDSIYREFLDTSRLSSDGDSLYVSESNTSDGGNSHLKELDFLRSQNNNTKSSTLQRNISMSDLDTSDVVGGGYYQSSYKDTGTPSSGRPKTGANVGAFKQKYAHLYKDAGGDTDDSFLSDDSYRQPQQSQQSAFNPSAYYRSGNPPLMEHPQPAILSPQPLSPKPMSLRPNMGPSFNSRESELVHALEKRGDQSDRSVGSDDSVDIKAYTTGLTDTHSSHYTYTNPLLSESSVVQTDHSLMSSSLSRIIPQHAHNANASIISTPTDLTVVAPPRTITVAPSGAAAGTSANAAYSRPAPTSARAHGDHLVLCDNDTPLDIEQEGLFPPSALLDTYLALSSTHSPLNHPDSLFIPCSLSGVVHSFVITPSKSSNNTVVGVSHSTHTHSGVPTGLVIELSVPQQTVVAVVESVLDTHIQRLAFNDAHQRHCQLVSPSTPLRVRGGPHQRSQWVYDVDGTSLTESLLGALMSLDWTTQHGVFKTGHTGADLDTCVTAFVKEVSLFHAHNTHSLHTPESPNTTVKGGHPLLKWFVRMAGFTGVNPADQAVDYYGHSASGEPSLSVAKSFQYPPKTANTDFKDVVSTPHITLLQVYCQLCFSVRVAMKQQLSPLEQEPAEWVLSPIRTDSTGEAVVSVALLLEVLAQPDLAVWFPASVIAIVQDRLNTLTDNRMVSWYSAIDVVLSVWAIIHTQTVFVAQTVFIAHAIKDNGLDKHLFVNIKPNPHPSSCTDMAYIPQHMSFACFMQAVLTIKPTLSVSECVFLFIEAVKLSSVDLSQYSALCVSSSVLRVQDCEALNLSAILSIANVPMRAFVQTVIKHNLFNAADMAALIPSLHTQVPALLGGSDASVSLAGLLVVPSSSTVSLMTRLSPVLVEALRLYSSAYPANPTLVPHTHSHATQCSPPAVLQRLRLKVSSALMGTPSDVCSQMCLAIHAFRHRMLTVMTSKSSLVLNDSMNPLNHITLQCNAISVMSALSACLHSLAFTVSKEQHPQTSKPPSWPTQLPWDVVTTHGVSRDGASVVCELTSFDDDKVDIRFDTHMATDTLARLFQQVSVYANVTSSIMSSVSVSLSDSLLNYLLAHCTLNTNHTAQLTDMKASHMLIALSAMTCVFSSLYSLVETHTHSPARVLCVAVDEDEWFVLHHAYQLHIGTQSGHRYSKRITDSSIMDVNTAADDLSPFFSSLHNTIKTVAHIAPSQPIPMSASSLPLSTVSPPTTDLVKVSAVSDLVSLAQTRGRSVWTHVNTDTVNACLNLYARSAHVTVATAFSCVSNCVLVSVAKRFSELYTMSTAKLSVLGVTGFNLGVDSNTPTNHPVYQHWLAWTQHITGLESLPMHKMNKVLLLRLWLAGVRRRWHTVHNQRDFMSGTSSDSLVLVPAFGNDVDISTVLTTVVCQLQLPTVSTPSPRSPLLETVPRPTVHEHPKTPLSAKRSDSPSVSSPRPVATPSTPSTPHNPVSFDTDRSDRSERSVLSDLSRRSTPMDMSEDDLIPPPSPSQRNMARQASPRQTTALAQPKLPLAVDKKPTVTKPSPKPSPRINPVSPSATRQALSETDSSLNQLEELLQMVVSRTNEPGEHASANLAALNTVALSALVLRLRRSQRSLSADVETLQVHLHLLQSQYEQERTDHARTRAELDKERSTVKFQLSTVEMSYKDQINKLNMEKNALSSKLTELRVSGANELSIRDYVRATGQLPPAFLGTGLTPAKSHNPLVKTDEMERRLEEDRKKMTAEMKQMEYIIDHLNTENARLVREGKIVNSSQLNADQLHHHENNKLKAEVASLKSSLELASTRIEHLQRSLDDQHADQPDMLTHSNEAVAELRKRYEGMSSIDDVTDQVTALVAKHLSSTPSQSAHPADDARWHHRYIELASKHAASIQPIVSKLQWYAENQALISKMEDTQRQLSAEVLSLTTQVEDWRDAALRKAGEQDKTFKHKITAMLQATQPHVVKKDDTSVADKRKIVQLERHIMELEQVIRSRNPNSASAIVLASRPDVLESARVSSLNKELDEVKESMSDMNGEMKVKLRSLAQENEIVRQGYERVRRKQSLQHQEEIDKLRNLKPVQKIERLTQLLEQTRESFAEKINAKNEEIAVLKYKLTETEAKLEKNADSDHDNNNKKNNGGGSAELTRLVSQIELMTSLNSQLAQQLHQERSVKKPEQALPKPIVPALVGEGSGVHATTVGVDEVNIPMSLTTYTADTVAYSADTYVKMPDFLSHIAYVKHQYHNAQLANTKMEETRYKERLTLATIGLEEQVELLKQQLNTQQTMHETREMSSRSQLEKMTVMWKLSTEEGVRVKGVNSELTMLLHQAQETPHHLKLQSLLDKVSAMEEKHKAQMTLVEDALTFSKNQQELERSQSARCIQIQQTHLDSLMTVHKQQLRVLRGELEGLEATGVDVDNALDVITSLQQYQLNHEAIVRRQIASIPHLSTADMLAMDQQLFREHHSEAVHRDHSDNTHSHVHDSVAIDALHPTVVCGPAFTAAAVDNVQLLNPQLLQSPLKPSEAGVDNWATPVKGQKPPSMAALLLELDEQSLLSPSHLKPVAPQSSVDLDFEAVRDGDRGTTQAEHLQFVAEDVDDDDELFKHQFSSEAELDAFINSRTQFTLPAPEHTHTGVSRLPLDTIQQDSNSNAHVEDQSVSVMKKHPNRPPTTTTTTLTSTPHQQSSQVTSNVKKTKATTPRVSLLERQTQLVASHRSQHQGETEKNPTSNSNPSSQHQHARRRSSGVPSSPPVEVQPVRRQNSGSFTSRSHVPHQDSPISQRPEILSARSMRKPTTIHTHAQSHPHKPHPEPDLDSSYFSAVLSHDPSIAAYRPKQMSIEELLRADPSIHIDEDVNITID